MKNEIFLAAYSLHMSPTFVIFFKKKITRKEQINICSFLLQIFFFFSARSNDIWRKGRRDLEKGPARSGDPARSGERADEIRQSSEIGRKGHASGEIRAGSSSKSSSSRSKNQLLRRLTKRTKKI
jgi:hypothetical protein